MTAMPSLCLVRSPSAQYSMLFSSLRSLIETTDSLIKSKHATMSISLGICRDLMSLYRFSNNFVKDFLTFAIFFVQFC